MRLIDADEVFCSDCEEKDQCENVVCDVKSMPTIDSESLRPQGEWVLGVVEPGYFTPGGNRPWICSECGKVISWMLDKPRENYCPNCGVKMKGGNT